MVVGPPLKCHDLWLNNIYFILRVGLSWAGESINIKMSSLMIRFTIHLGGLMEENLGSDSESFSGDFLAKKKMPMI